MGAPLSYAQRQAVTRKLYAMKQRGEISYDDLVAKMNHTIHNPEWRNPKVAEAGLHQLSTVMGAIELSLKYGTGLANFVGRSTDVLSTLAGNGTALIRTDLETTIENIYVDEFPGWARFRKFPANGLVHSYIVSTDFDAADVVFVSELDPAPKGQGQYSVENAPIAIGLTERGTSLKELYAVRQSGMSYNSGEDADDLELDRGTTAVAYSFQKCLYQGTTISGHTGTDEFGTYFANTTGSGTVATGFQGLRGMLSNLSNFDSFYPGYNRAGPSGKGPIAIDQGNLTIVQAINQAARRIMNNGARPTAIHLSANAAEQLSREGGNIIRLDQAEAMGTTLGVSVDAVITVAGKLPLVVVPGDSIGSYTAGSNSSYNGSVVEDIYVLCERVMGFATLGAPGLVTIEIPVGVDGTLGKRYLQFQMAGLVNRSPAFSAKIRIPFVA